MLRTSTDSRSGSATSWPDSRCTGPQPDRYTFTHTEIDPAFGGRGLASILIKAALDEMRARGIAVLPQCPFVRRYISRHLDYLDLVPAAERARFDLPAEAAGAPRRVRRASAPEARW